MNLELLYSGQETVIGIYHVPSSLCSALAQQTDRFIDPQVSFMAPKLLRAKRVNRESVLVSVPLQAWRAVITSPGHPTLPISLPHELLTDHSLRVLLPMSQIQLQILMTLIPQGEKK